jgi:hypothetical protein
MFTLDRQFPFPSIHQHLIDNLHFHKSINNYNNYNLQLFKIKTPLSTNIQSICVIEMNKVYRLQNTIYIQITKHEQIIQIIHDFHQL